MGEEAQVARREEDDMSLNSMTGHGRGTASANGIKVEVELSSVNRKQLDISVSVPRSLTALVPRMDEVIHAAVSRGRVSGESHRT